MQRGSMRGACIGVGGVFDPALCCVHRAAAHGLVCTGPRPEGVSEGESSIAGQLQRQLCLSWGWTQLSMAGLCAGAVSRLGLDSGWTGLGLAGRLACLQRRRSQEACMAWRCVSRTALGACLLGSPVLLKRRSWSGGSLAAAPFWVCQWPRPASWCLRQLRGACVQAAALVLAAFVFGAASLELLGLTSGAVCWTAAGGSLETLWAGLGPFVMRMGACVRGQGACIQGQGAWGGFQGSVA